MSVCITDMIAVPADADLVFISDVLHHVSDRPELLPYQIVLTSENVR